MPRPRTRFKSGQILCPRCERWLSPEHFHINKTSGRPASYCRRCKAALKFERGFSLPAGVYQNLYAEQRGRCAICGREEGIKYRLLVDKNPTTGAVRGLLCHNCRSGLAVLREDVGKLIAAAAYLRNGGPLIDLHNEGHRKIFSEWNRLFPTLDLPHMAVARWLEVSGGQVDTILAALEETKRRVRYLGPSTVRYATNVVASTAQRAQATPVRKPGEKEPLTEKDREMRRKIDEYFKTHPSPWPDEDDGW